jgi:hypothetical protein
MATTVKESSCALAGVMIGWNRAFGLPISASIYQLHATDNVSHLQAVFIGACVAEYVTFQATKVWVMVDDISHSAASATQLRQCHRRKPPEHFTHNLERNACYHGGIVALKRAL